MPFELESFGPSILFCPGDRPDRFAKAMSASDIAVLDLEDAVRTDGKDAARGFVSGFLKQGKPRVIIRINDPRSERGIEDAKAIIEAGCRAILLPKTETAEEILAIALLAPNPGELRLIATIESARGALAMESIFGTRNVAAVSWGPYDLAADMGATEVRDAEGRLLSPFIHIRDRLLICAAAHRIQAIDTVTAELSNPDILEREAGDAASIGFTAKFAIHPKQVATIRSRFMPSAAEVERCQRLIAHAESNAGAFLFEGQMVDEPMLRRAKHNLAVAQRIQRRSN